MSKFEDEEENDEENLPDQEKNITDDGAVEDENSDEDSDENSGEVKEYEYRNRYRTRVGGGIHNESSMFNESIVDNIIQSYFDPESEKLIREEKNEKRKKFLKENYKLNKFEIERLSESQVQRDTAVKFLKSNPNSQVLGTTNKKNMIIKLGNDQYKITKNGRLL